jgi:hypothetical protein
VGDDCDGAHRQQDEDDRHLCDRPGEVAQMPWRRHPGRGMNERRDEHEQDELRLELDLRDARQEADRDAADDQHDRERNVEGAGDRNEHRGGGDKSDQ